MASERCPTAPRVLVALLGLGLAGGTACRRPGHQPVESSPLAFSAAEALSTPAAGSDAGYARALVPRPFRFPADHGSHPEFRTEWWYFTGHLAVDPAPGEGGGARSASSAPRRRFGFQLTFFRSALAPVAPRRPSAWATNQAWLAHFALGDFEGGRFHAYESWSREALGLAGATADPLRIWLRGWSAEGQGPSGFPLRLSAESPPRAGSAGAEGVALDLLLDEGKPPVAQGDHGLSRKSAEPGNASYYYSLPRLPARGTLTLGGARLPVSGLAWMDREWSTSALAADEVGWDWFSLQLADGRELMLYRLRRRDGTFDPASSGTLIERDGSARPLQLSGASAVAIEVLDRWRSPTSGARYPARWRLRLPEEGLDLTVAPLLADQELRLSFRYWEGAVAVTRSSDRAPLGQGFVELTGYGAAW